MGFSTLNENTGGMKKNTTSVAETTVATNPPDIPPIQELKKTAG
jgi:hypothetical protein